MKAHLLNWTLGPALLGAILASGGAAPPEGPALEALLGFTRGLIGLTGLFVAFYFVVLVLGIIVHRLNGHRFVWAEVRTGATALAVQKALLAVALTVLLAAHQLAAFVAGGWPRGVPAAAGGAVTAAALGLLMGLGVARLRLPQRLGLDKAVGPTAGGTKAQSPAAPGAADVTSDVKSRHR